ncbi:MAG: CxxC-x17-CxxC domain-containing protein [Patescibacteria group bacterium]
MSDFKRSGKFSGKRKSSGGSSRGGFGGGRSAGRGSFGRPSFDRSDESREMFEATCADCGKSCEVPFKPNGRKPVLCRECFRKTGPSESRDDSRSEFKPSFRRSDSSDRGSDRRPAAPTPNYKVELDKINSKLDQIIQALGQDEN